MNPISGNPVPRYVKEVERSLSGPHRLGISARIYKALSIKADELEKRLGRKPTEAEMAEMLAAFGAPAEVATRYSKMAAIPPAHDLIERYLAAVGRRLPDEQARDITAELREELVARTEAKESELGRAPEKKEIAEILKSFGPPTVVAGRYSGREYLIGPKLYPWFWPAQRTALSIIAVIWITVAAVRALQSSSPISMFIIHVWNGWGAALIAFSAVTIAFVAMENTTAAKRMEAMWNPGLLPQDRVRAPKPLFDSIFALVFDVIFILWWIGIIAAPEFEQRSVDFEGASVWDSVHLPVLVLALLTAAVHAADILYPAWSRLRSGVSILGHLGGLAVMAVLLQADKLVNITPRPGEEASAAQAEWWLDGPFRLVLAATAVFWAIGLLIEIGRFAKSMRARTAPALA